MPVAMGAYKDMADALASLAMSGKSDIDNDASDFVRYVCGTLRILHPSALPFRFSIVELTGVDPKPHSIFGS